MAKRGAGSRRQGQREKLEEAAVAIIGYTGVRPSEARGLRWEEWDRTRQHIAVRRGVWHRIVGTTKTQQRERFVTVTDELREILLDLWKEQGSPISGYILARGKGQPVNLDNMARLSIRPALSRCAICKEGNSKTVADKHYIKPQTVLPDVRKAVNDAVSGLIRGEK